MNFGVFGREELHQIRPDRHHRHGDGPQGGAAARPGPAGRPAHAGAEEEAASLTLAGGLGLIPSGPSPLDLHLLL